MVNKKWKNTVSYMMYEDSASEKTLITIKTNSSSSDIQTLDLVSPQPSL